MTAYCLSTSYFSPETHAAVDTGVFSVMKIQAAGHRRLLTKVTAANWADLKTLCEAGGNEVALTDSFDTSSYTEQIDFSGRTCVVIGHGKTLAAGKSGRFFYGSGAGSSLEVHGLVLKNGQDSVRGCVRVSRKFLNFLEKN
jgi:hypothetical protein